MGRGYHLLPKITLEEITNKTSIKVIKETDNGNDCYYLQDSFKNICHLNISTENPNEAQNASVLVHILDFYGKNSERHILYELFEKLGVMFYNDSMIWEGIHNGGYIKRGGVIEFMRYVLGTSIISDEFIQNENLEEILVEFEIEEEQNNSIEVDNLEDGYGIEDGIDDEVKS